MSSYLTDSATGQDALHFSDFRPALKEILTQAETPLTVGVFGAWGSGKTSLMRMLYDEIDSSGAQEIRPVWFTAWKYDRHEVLWRALILRVLNALYPRESGEGMREEWPILAADKQTAEQKKLVALLNGLEESVYQAAEWQEIGPRSIKWWQLLSNAGQAGAEIAAAISTGGAFPALKKALGGDVPADKIQKAAEAISHEVRTRQRQQLVHMEQFEATFKEAVDLLGSEKPGRLIVFVDDLDRCLPEKAVEVLEAIKLFLEVPGAVFVLGMDREVIQRGIEARYGTFFHEKLDQRVELPIRGDVYLQKIVQIPFHLPVLASGDLADFIAELDSSLSEPTRQSFALGLFPNPRQVKRSLNIFRLLQQIARAREASGRLPAKSIAWPLLAKTVIIQTQYPELYRQWRQYPTLVQLLEAEYARRPGTEEEMILGGWRGRSLGRGMAAEKQAPDEGDDGPAAADSPAEDKPAEAQSGGLLDPYLQQRREYALLARMLAYPPPDEEGGQGRERSRFAGLSRTEVAAYVRLAGAVEAEVTATPVDVPADLLAEMLSGEAVRIQDAAARLDETEAEKDGSLHQAARQGLLTVIEDPAQPVIARASAGDALAQIGDPRFRADAWFLPAEPLLGFVEIPTGPFLMGSDPERDGSAREEEQPQHEVKLPAYYIGRYPVTVAQFKAFVEASNHEPVDENSLRGPANHPVVRITWHEALAYCRWLTDQLRQWPETPAPLAGLLRQGGNGKGSWWVRLPSEAQWEKAARGEKGRIYPWGDTFAPERLNSKDGGLGRTTAVGCFPGGASPYGLLDCSGNVFEWTGSLWGSDSEEPTFAYPYDPDDGQEDLAAGDDILRVIRGGYFNSDRSRPRCACRYWSYPYYGYYPIGFRVLLSPLPGR